MHGIKKAHTRRGLAGCFWLFGVSALILVILAGMLVVIALRPSLAAGGVDVLRAVMGDQAVSQLEMALFKLQDGYSRWQYSAGFATPAAPWQAPGPVYQPTGSVPKPAIPAATEPAAPPGAAANITPQPAWKPGDVTSTGELQGAGVWSAYITSSSGAVMAYRTFIQPDPQRLYAIVGVVAFDLTQTRLHFILGTAEPYSADSPPRSGEIPPADRAPEVLLAMFNGGFKARHGRFGAMAGGITALPARAGLGTLAMYSDGSVRMGEWDSEIQPSPDMTAFRQNGPLVIHGGQINAEIYNNLPADWGYTVDDVSPTWRSGLALSADAKTLYYLCGPALSMEMLARSMLAVSGVTTGMQLDINTYWVHFVAVRLQGGRLGLDPLFPDMMRENIDRYLQPYSRDYFYVTTRN
jgi:hypothetical protein